MSVVNIEILYAYGDLERYEHVAIHSGGDYGGRYLQGLIYMPRSPKEYNGLQTSCQLLWKDAVVAVVNHTFHVECKYEFC